MSAAAVSTARRWVVVFNGARDGYQVPLALQEVQRLEALVTDWYSPLDRSPVHAVTRALPIPVGRALRARYVAGLPSHRVVTSLVDTVAQRLTLRSLDWVDARLGTRAGRLARARRSGMFAYSYYAHAAFAAYGAGPGPKLLFQVHPHPGWLRDLLLDEMRRVPDAAASLRSEQEVAASPARRARLCEEPTLADACIVASTFARRTLEERGIDGARVHVVPYGVDLARFTPPTDAPVGPFRVLFVGQMIQRKGLSYLLDAWSRLALPDAELVIAGRGAADHAQLARVRGQVRIETHASADRLQALYRSSDVFCMPSLAEGFGLVYLEALACGTPVIATPNTGAADLVREGQEGFIIGTRDIDALAERLEWCHAHRDALHAMRAHARRRAEEHSWGRFRQGIAAISTALAS